MPRFVFRQVQSQDLALFLRDGEIRAKNHAAPQLCHQASYQEIVNRRGTNEFDIPTGGVVNDYVQFYFSPITGFAYTINQGNVALRSPSGEDLGTATDADRVFFVCAVESFSGSGLQYCFSNFPLNSRAPMPVVKTDLAELETHVHWGVFDEGPRCGHIPEIGYDGVCKFFFNQDSPPERQYRRQKRMAEFLVQGAVPLSHVACIIAKSTAMRDQLQQQVDASRWRIPVYAKPGCYF